MSILSSPAVPDINESNDVHVGHYMGITGAEGTNLIIPTKLKDLKEETFFTFSWTKAQEKLDAMCIHFNEIT